MENNRLYQISKNILNLILLDGFDCTNAMKASENGIEYNEEIDMHMMGFIVNDESFGEEIYISTIVGDYTIYNNKFYPFFIRTYNASNKDDFLEIDIQKLVACMIDMDNIYNNGLISNVIGKKDINDNILQYEILRGAKDYIVVALNRLNLDGALSCAFEEGIACSKSKMDKVYKNNMIFLSEDKDTGTFRAELVTNGVERSIVFESVDTYEFYTYLESEAFKLFFTDSNPTILSKKEAKKIAKQERQNRIDESVNELLEYCIYRLEEETIKIQTEELTIASDLLFEQYEYNEAILDILNKVLIKESSIVEVAELVASGMEKKLECINFLAKKTYLDKPRRYMYTIFNGLAKQDNIYENIDDDIKPYVKSKLLYELDLFQYNVVHPQIVQRGKIFAREIEELNLIIDEVQELFELVKSNDIEKYEALEQIKNKKEKIEKSNGIKLRSTYKKLHKFAVYLGFEAVRQRGTSHLIYQKNAISVPIPDKRGDIKPGLLSAIVKQLGSSRDEFCKFVNL